MEGGEGRGGEGRGGEGREEGGGEGGEGGEEHGLVLNSRFRAPKLENSEVVTIKKLESVFCAQFEFRTQTTVNKSQTQ